MKRVRGEMEDIFKPFQAVVADPVGAARDWKETKSLPVIGYLFSVFPDELIHAGGALPFPLMGIKGKISRALSWVPGYLCQSIKSNLEWGLSGDLDILNFLFIPYCCDSSRELIHIWLAAIPSIPADSFRVPKKSDKEEVVDFLKNELVRVKNKIEMVTGEAIKVSTLMASITLYNKNRRLLRNVYDFFRSHPGGISHSQLDTLFKSAYLMPREEHTVHLENLIVQLGKKDIEPPSDVIRIFLQGRACDSSGLMEIFDNVGIQIVGDDFVKGYRSELYEIPENLDPIDGLIDRHLALSPYQGFHQPNGAWSSFLVEEVKRTEAQGVIFISSDFCELAAFNIPDLRNRLMIEGIPSISIQTGKPGISSSQMLLRIEAFLEMIKI